MPDNPVAHRFDRSGSRSTSTNGAQTSTAAGSGDDAPRAEARLRAVVFDVGGVLLDWNPRHLYRKLFDGDSEAMERFLAEVCTPDWNRRQDEGRPWAEAVAELSSQFPDKARLIAAYDSRWDEMVAGLLPETVTLARDLKQRGVVLYCLTNFSCDKFRRVRDRWNVFALFDGIVVSGEEGVTKPDPVLYRILLDRFGLVASECLFVDDVPANVAAAEGLGIAGHVFHSAGGLADELQARKLLPLPAAP